MLEAEQRLPSFASKNAYAALGLRIVERDGLTICAEIQTTSGLIVIIAEAFVVEKQLWLTGVHIDGKGLTRTLIHRLAKALGEGEDVGETIVQGGTRTSGSRPGSIPTPIRVKVKQ